jgi:CRISPR-associated protein Cmr2
MPYLIQINIGPVQDFIATARRSRDLWFGSWLLSELAKAAAKEIVAAHKKESLIFPFVSDPSKLEVEDFNVPNKILAIVQISDKQQVEDFCEEVRRKVIARLNEIREGAFLQIKGEIDETVAVQQIEDMLEFYWTAVAFDGSDAEYKKARRKLEYLTMARKATRDFKKVSWGSNRPKSALDGQRESVIPEKFYSQAGDDEPTQMQKAHQLFKNYRVREKERLCGVGLLKRHGNRGSNDKFLSTSHIAALPLLNKLKKNDEAAKEAVKEFKKRLFENGIDLKEFHTVLKPHPVFGEMDGQFLYPGRMREFFAERDKFENAREAVRDLLRDAFHRAEPSPYYALLLADGDNMGKAIDAKKNIEGHRRLSEALSQFAESVKKIVDDKHKGSLIYAGGDDVLALVPLHTVLDCAKDLADGFKETLKSFEFEENGKPYQPTLSVGIAVAHHIEPLSDALELARQSEKEAKTVKGKNALAIIVDKRSGAPKTIKGKWGEIDERLRELIEFDKAGDVSRQAAYELRDLASRLETDGVAESAQLDELKVCEAKRILKRKLKEVGEKEFSESKFSKIFALLKEKDGITKLANELIIAKVFADALRQAEGATNA